MLVPGLMQDFRAQIDPAVQFQLHSESGFSADLLKAVEEGRLDLAFTSHPGDPAQFESFAFQRTPFVVITPMGHPLARKTSVSLRDTLPYPQICFAPRSGLRKSVDALFCSIDAAPIVAMETEEDAVIAGLAAAGFGIAVLPDDPLFQSLPLAVLPLTDPDTPPAPRISPGGAAHPCPTPQSSSGRFVRRSWRDRKKQRFPAKEIAAFAFVILRFGRSKNIPLRISCLRSPDAASRSETLSPAFQNFRKASWSVRKHTGSHLLHGTAPNTN